MDKNKKIGLAIFASLFIVLVIFIFILFSGGDDNQDQVAIANTDFVFPDADDLPKNRLEAIDFDTNDKNKSIDDFLNQEDSKSKEMNDFQEELSRSTKRLQNNLSEEKVESTPEPTPPKVEHTYSNYTRRVVATKKDDEKKVFVRKEGNIIHQDVKSNSDEDNSIKLSNPISAFVSQKLKIKEQSRLPLILNQDLIINNCLVKAGTSVYGVCHFETGRVKVKISSIYLNGQIVPADINLYDRDGMEGLYWEGEVRSEVTADVQESAINDATSHLSGIPGSDLVRDVANSISRSKQRDVWTIVPKNYEVILKS